MDDGATRRDLIGGAVGGLAGGAAFMLGMSALVLARGTWSWGVLKLPALPFFVDERLARPDWETVPVLVGLAVHVALSVGWGLLFGLLFVGLSRAATVVAGLTWGVVVWLSMFYVVLPVVGAFDVTRYTPVPLALVQHLGFGLVVALGFLPFQRRDAVRSGPRLAAFSGRPDRA